MSGFDSMKSAIIGTDLAGLSCATQLQEEALHISKKIHLRITEVNFDLKHHQYKT